jgi:hypothetical protein
VAESVTGAHGYFRAESMAIRLRASGEIHSRDIRTESGSTNNLFSRQDDFGEKGWMVGKGQLLAEFNPRGNGFVRL